MSSPSNNNSNEPEVQSNIRNGQSLPAISIPKGGGAIRGIGEKFEANPVTGTASGTIPIFTSPGRSGFSPFLSLSYDSGSGNGTFGFGWHLSLPSITRKTDKGLPLYRDAEESDTFILSGSEDLVPELIETEDGNNWHFNSFVRIVGCDKFKIQRYRPRIEALFVRIERWTNIVTGESHWRSISRDNITTLYGKDEESRVSDPKDPSRIFSWLICESYDDKGNAILYEYKKENSTGIDLSLANERNRTEESRSANRHISSIKYGNLPSRLVQPDLSQMSWMFQIVFDYGEYDSVYPTPVDTGKWLSRHDPFSSYRAGFEIRTYRLCQRVLMFHHFPNEECVGEDCLVRSTDFVYRSIRNNTEDLKRGHPIASFISSVTQSGYRRLSDGDSNIKYLKRSYPPVEFEYSQAIINDEVKEVEPTSLENLPYGIDGMRYKWVDLDGEGMSGILTEQADSWFYKPNLGGGKFGPNERVAFKPSISDLNSREQKLMDLAGDGHLDLVSLGGPVSGFYERDVDQRWKNFVQFQSLPILNWDDPNLRLVDLTGDGLADVLVTESEVLTWYPSLAERGFGSALRTPMSQDEELGPRLVFSDGTQSIYLADMSGDGLTDLVRVQNGEVCYWSNLGRGRFGHKVVMDRSPWFDAPDIFDQSRIRLADIDGSGVTDIIYIGREDGVRLYFNQSGNSWSEPVIISNFPRIDNISNVMALDLFGNGTACLVWSSLMPGDTIRHVRYIELMGQKKGSERSKEKPAGQKPHLLISIKNNIGDETHLEYASSTQFYLEDKAAGRPWPAKLPFPVQVVKTRRTYDRISRNRFTTQYRYHDGYFDGVEREFRGFGMIEHYDTEEFETLSRENQELSHTQDNIEVSTHVAPVLTKTWFHTGIYSGPERVSGLFVGFPGSDHRGDYYREPGLSNLQVQGMCLPDTVMPAILSREEEREASRSLKGSMIRQEVYALDGTSRAQYPYIVTEQNFMVRILQPRHIGNRHAVFFTHSREIVSHHYERSLVPVINGQVIDERMGPADMVNSSNITWVPDPRIQHQVNLEVDSFGNVLKSVSIGYGRRFNEPDPSLLAVDREKQRLIHIIYTANKFTQSVIDDMDSYRTPLPAENCSYELRKVKHDKSGNTLGKLYKFDELLGFILQAGDGVHDIDYEDIDFGRAKKVVMNNPEEANKYFRRLIEHTRILYRPNDLGVAEGDPSTLLPLGTAESLALPGEEYRLAFTQGLLSHVFHRGGKSLLSSPADVLGCGDNGDTGGYVHSQYLKEKGIFPHSDPDDQWWIPTGRVFLSPKGMERASEELEYAHQHFFIPLRSRDPFHTDAVSTESSITLDAYDLLMLASMDPVGNIVTVGRRLQTGHTDLEKPRNDYRVLQPKLVTDPNRNQIEVLFDALGMVVATAVKGKDESEGDNLDSFEADLTQTDIDGFYDAQDPHMPAFNLLRNASTRIIYDLFRFYRTQRTYAQDPTKWLPVYTATLARETHVSDGVSADGLRIQITFSYSDGFGREIQKKIQAEPGPVVDDGPTVGLRWVGSGWTIFNNKGKPVRQYEPFFSQLAEKCHRFEFGEKIGVSPILFYDPMERVVVTLHPNHTYEKVLIEPWKHVIFDVNDTVAPYSNQTGDPRTDPDIQGYVREYFTTLNDPYWQTWFEQRQNGKMGKAEQTAAENSAAHANTPTTAYFDTLGRQFITIGHNRLKETYSGTVKDEMYPTRLKLDIEGNQREIRDALVQNGDGEGRIVRQYDYDMLGTPIRQINMDAGTRWMLNDVTGKPIRTWDSRNHIFRFEYDALRRLLRLFVTGADPASPQKEILTERMVYGEQHPEGELHNLRGVLYLQFDQAGIMSNERHDFNGNLLKETRRFAKQYHQVLDWRFIDNNHVALPTSFKQKIDLEALEVAIAPQLESEIFINLTKYDARKRPIQIIYPHSNRAGTTVNVTQPVYNRASLLERIDTWLGLEIEPAALLDWKTATQHFITNIEYNAKGQRKLIEYGNGVITTYTFDHLTFRLTHLQTLRRGSEKLQDLFYYYDPAGNFSSIHDYAQQTIFFSGQVINPVAEYTYDAVYRLIGAIGREHIGQASLPQATWEDKFRTNLAHPTDGQKMRTYLEAYAYDAVGNILNVSHRIAGNGRTHSIGNWIRRFNYEEESLTEEGKNSNLLSATIVGGITESNKYDPHGNIERMSHLAIHADKPNMQWGFKDQLSQIDIGGGGTVHYVYNGNGQRVRKVHKHVGSLVEERIYFGNFEIYRKHNANGLKIERETLHVMDDQQRIALVETRTQGTDVSLPQLIRYQFPNHLGSSVLELDDLARIISYEEFTPYGSTSYESNGNQNERPKRYRYTAKERDEESGLYYYGTRYYAPWILRWLSCDQVGLEGVRSARSPYEYNLGNPIRFFDPIGQDPESNEEIFRRLDIDYNHVLNAKEVISGYYCSAKPWTIEPFLRQLAYEPSFSFGSFRSRVTSDAIAAIQFLDENVFSPEPKIVNNKILTEEFRYYPNIGWRTVAVETTPEAHEYYLEQRRNNRNLLPIAIGNQRQGI